MKHSYRAECTCERCTKERNRRQAQSDATPRHQPVRRRTPRRKGYLGTDESMDAFLSGRPMSDDDY